MGHDGQVDVQEALNAVRHADGLGLVELVGLDGGGDAFLPAGIGKGVGFYVEVRWDVSYLSCCTYHGEVE